VRMVGVTNVQLHGHSITLLKSKFLVLKLERQRSVSCPCLEVRLTSIAAINRQLLSPDFANIMQSRYRELSCEIVQLLI
jgi:hypothetical protein